MQSQLGAMDKHMMVKPRKRLFHMKTTRLAFMMLLTFIIFLFEIVFGYITNSMALVADSFHMLSDVVALAVALASVRISKRQSPKNTFGWVRAEVLGGLVNSVFLMALCFSILVEAIKRMIDVEKVEKVDFLLIVGGIGLAFNLIGLFLFRDGHGHGHGHGGHGHSHGGAEEKKGHKHGHSHDSGKKKKRGGKHHSPETVKPSDDPVNARTQPASVTAENELMPRYSDDLATEGVEVQGLLTHHDASHVDVVDNVHPPSGSKVESEGFIEKEEAFETSHTSNEGSGAQLNMRGVFLHVLGDFLGSVIVIVSGLAIKYIPEEHEWKFYLDPAMSILLVIIMVNTTRPLLQESAMILLQTVPTHIQVKDIKQRLENTPGVLNVHELHVWQLAGNRVIASVHIQCADPENYMAVAERVKNFFHNEGIHSTTVQPEFPDYESNEEDCALPCAKECAPKTCCGNGVAKTPAVTVLPDDKPPDESQPV